MATRMNVSGRAFTDTASRSTEGAASGTLRTTPGGCASRVSGCAFPDGRHGQAEHNETRVLTAERARVAVHVHNRLL